MAANDYAQILNAKLGNINEFTQSNVFNTASHVLLAAVLAKHRLKSYRSQSVECRNTILSSALIVSSQQKIREKSMPTEYGCGYSLNR